MTLSVRDFREGDETALWDVFYSAIHDLASADYTPAQINAWAPSTLDLSKWAARMRRIAPFVAESEGGIVGYGDVQTDGYIDHLFVKPSAARRGVGSSLMERIHQAARLHRIAALFSNVSVTARPFFEKWGFSMESPQTVTIRGVTLMNFRMRKQMSLDRR
jgi:putative acetyltransferase